MEKDVVGKMYFLALNGEVEETVEYADVESYLSSIRKESNDNPDGFKFQTITSLPEVRKSVDDIIYGAHGLDNPHGLDWYRKSERGK